MISRNHPRDASSLRVVNAAPVDSAVVGNGAVGSREERPLRIAFATEYLPPSVSGIANRCKNLVKGYREQGHKVTVFGCHGTDAEYTVASIPTPFYNEQRTFIFPPLVLVGQLLNVFVDVPYDIVHVVSPLCFAFVFLMPLFKLRGVKIYVSYHVLLDHYKTAYFGDNQLLIMLLETIFVVLYFLPLVWFADVVGIPSKTADWPVYKFSKQIHFMKSGLNLDVFVPSPRHTQDVLEQSLAASLPLPPSLAPPVEGGTTAEPMSRSASLLAQPVTADGPVLLYVGRLAPEKNVEFLISALRHPALADASLVIVGDGPSRPGLEALAKRLFGSDAIHSRITPDDTAVEEHACLARATATQGGVEARRRVVFAGMVRDERVVARYYGDADVFVSASASETFGFTVAEAMACGTPSVVVRAGAFAQVYRMVDAWMFEDGNVDDFAGRIGRVYADGNIARIAARKISVASFGVSTAVKDLLQMYESIVDGTNSKRIGI
ncbi:hypothetical protein HK101_003688 [Irineochytrium annulatum]|nr:hypothetical protein HK101_003688 [Irineochytrium annulatum]